MCSARARGRERERVGGREGDRGGETGKRREKPINSRILIMVTRLQLLNFSLHAEEAMGVSQHHDAVS